MNSENHEDNKVEQEETIANAALNESSSVKSRTVRNWIIVVGVLLVITAPFILVNSSSSRTEEEKRILLEQVEAENKRSGYSELSENSSSASSPIE